MIQGTARGFECSREAWELVGEASEVRLPRANFTSSSTPRYGRLPLGCVDGGRGLRVGAGQTRGFFVMTSSSRGMVLRAKHQYAWVAGEESERDDNVVVRTGTKECVHDRSETPSYLYGTKECGPLAQHIRTRMHAHTHTHTCAHKYTHVQDCYLVAGTTQQMQPSNVSTTLSTLLPLLASSTIPSVSSMNSMIGARRESSKEQQLQPQ